MWEHVGHTNRVAGEESRLYALLSESSEVFLTLDADFRILFASPSSMSHPGLDPSRLLGRILWDCTVLGSEDVAPSSVAAALAEPGASTELTVRFGRPAMRMLLRIRNRLDEPEVRAHVVVISALVPVLDPVAAVRAERDGSAALADAERQARFQADLLEAAGRSIVATDLSGRVSYWNRAAEQMFGWTSADACGRKALDLVITDIGSTDEDGARANIETLSAGGTLQHDAWLTRRDGSRFFGSVTVTALLDDDGLCGTIAVTADLTERLESARANDEDRRRLADAQHNARLGSFEIDLTNDTSTWSDELFRILGLPEGTAAGPQLYRSLVHPDDLASVRQAGERTRAGEIGVEVVHRIIRPDGQTRWVRSCTSSLTPDGRVIAGTTQDITEHHLAEQQLAHQAEHDPLTGLPNRVRLTRHLEMLLARQRDGGAPATVVFLDLDRFKVINDGLGHATGDRVLQEVARRLGESIDANWMLGRLGGDEFVVVCDELVDAVQAVSHADRIGQALEVPIELDGRQLFLSASVGVAISRIDDSAETVLQSADTAMYAAKRQVGVRAHAFDERLQLQVRNRLELEDDLRRALPNGEFEMHYQPIIRLVDGGCVGFESLLRWNHPRRGMVGPGEFIPLAEETGLILPIGDWVLRESLAQLADWQREPEFVGLQVAVNLSANQLSSPDLVTRVRDTIAESGVSPSLLHLEITESLLMDGIEGSLQALNGLRRLGLQLAVDDFGTGYSSLSYLKRLPVHMLKIDRSFVDGLGSDPHDTSIVQAITAMADALGLELLAEGVETAAQLDALVELGCPMAQGFLWSRPMPATRAHDWLLEHQRP